jgi:hypothetical protein
LSFGLKKNKSIIKGLVCCAINGISINFLINGVFLGTLLISDDPLGKSMHLIDVFVKSDLAYLLRPLQALPSCFD